jgi:muconolactone delta-isomerase
MEAKNSQKIMDELATFPLIKFMKPDIQELAFHDNVHSGFPHLSLN